MPSIAQQDYLIISLTNPESLTPEQNERILDLHSRGLLLDTIISLSDGDEKFRVVSDEIDVNDTFSIIKNGSIMQIIVTLE